ncbi:MAG: response regulator, partial [Cyanobacteria bacterium P01_H01_bin.162]
MSPVESIHSNPSPLAEAGAGTVLVVDDTPANLSVLFDLLDDAGFQVLVAQDGLSALQKVEYAPPDLILLDVMMPGIDGFETCRRLKANP